VRDDVGDGSEGAGSVFSDRTRVENGVMSCGETDAESWKLSPSSIRIGRVPPAVAPALARLLRTSHAPSSKRKTAASVPTTIPAILPLSFSPEGRPGSYGA
jgi:hypothetical protein